MIWKVIQVGITSIIPKLVEDFYKYMTEEEKKQSDRSKYTESQTQIMLVMWKEWQDNKAMYKNQEAFAKAVNTRFGTQKASSTIVKHIKKSL